MSEQINGLAGVNAGRNGEGLPSEAAQFNVIELASTDELRRVRENDVRGQQARHEFKLGVVREITKSATDYLTTDYAA